MTEGDDALGFSMQMPQLNIGETPLLPSEMKLARSTTIMKRKQKFSGMPSRRDYDPRNTTICIMISVLCALLDNVSLNVKR